MKTQTENISQILKMYDIKSTLGTILIYKILDKSDNPISLIEIKKKVNGEIHLATIYRILEKLENKGVVNKLQFNEQKSFYELNRSPHNHFICSHCNKVIDIYLESENLSFIKKDILNKYNLKVQSASINFTGICSECKK